MIYLIRHGETAARREGRCIGCTDLPLSARGIRQMELLGNWFAGQMAERRICTGGKVYTSPLLRCRESADLLFSDGKPDILVRENLREASMGAWDGLTFREIRERYPGEYEKRGENIGDYRVPGAETFREAGERFLKELSLLSRQTPEDDLIVVAHAGVIRAAICLTEQIEMKSAKDVMAIPQPGGGVTTLSRQEENGRERFQVVRVGVRPAPLPDGSESI